MPKPLRTQFVIADGGRARWVRRSPDADDFVTTRELQSAAPSHGPPQGVVFASAGGPRSTVQEKRSQAQERRLHFSGVIADELNAQAAAHAFERLAIVAPARVLSAISQRLSPAAAAKLVRALPKDLTKTPDHQLGAWLRPLERG